MRDEAIFINSNFYKAIINNDEEINAKLLFLIHFQKI